MKRRTFIRNAGLDAGWLETLFANLVFQISMIPITFRAAQLSTVEYEASKALLKPGHLIMVGQSRYLSSLFIGGPFTHSLIYVGDGMCIESKAVGVRLVSYRSLFDYYDRLAILSVDDMTEEQAKGVVDFALEQYARPYDFWFDSTDQRAWFCTELVCAALDDKGLKLEMCAKTGYSRPHPKEFFMAGTTVLYTSTCLTKTNGSLKVCPPPAA